VGTDYLVDTSGGLSHVVAEVDSSGAVSVLYVRAGDMLLEEVRGGVAKMYEADGLGSVRSLLDTTGAQTDTWTYEGFGTTLSSTGTSVNPYRFAGERFVDGVGLYQNRARWLDTRVGRFVSRDPLRGHIEEPATLNPFGYALQNPALLSDPTGQEYTLTGVMTTVLVVGIMAAIVPGDSVTRLRLPGRHKIYILQMETDDEWLSWIITPYRTLERLAVQRAGSVAESAFPGAVYMNTRAEHGDVQRAIDDPDLIGALLVSHGEGGMIKEGAQNVCPAGWTDPRNCGAVLSPRSGSYAEPQMLNVSACQPGMAKEKWKQTFRAQMVMAPEHEIVDQETVAWVDEFTEWLNTQRRR
jgi:RHS repeat-associated protein